MQRGKSAILILAAFTTSPLAAAPTPPERPPASVVQEPLMRAHAELQRYGQWLVRVTEIERRVQQQLMGLQPAWQQAMSRPWPQGHAAMREYVRGALAQIDAANAEVAALALPRLEMLELPEDVRPAAMTTQVVRLNGDIRAVIADFLPMMDAMSSNPGAVEPVGVRILGNMRLVFASQLVLIRAQQAVTPREDPEWELAGFEIGFLRGAQRVFQAFDPFRPEVDRTLSTDLIAIAEELEANIESADRKVAADVAEMDAEVAAAERQADENQTRVLRRARAVLAINRDYLPIARRLSAHLRQGADLVRGQIVTPELLTRVFAPLREVRAGFDEVSLRQARAVAETP